MILKFGLDEHILCFGDCVKNSIFRFVDSFFETSFGHRDPFICVIAHIARLVGKCLYEDSLEVLRERFPEFLFVHRKQLLNKVYRTVICSHRPSVY